MLVHSSKRSEKGPKVELDIGAGHYSKKILDMVRNENLPYYVYDLPENPDGDSMAESQRLDLGVERQ